MPYFPNTVMPLTPKQDAVGLYSLTNPIRAKEFNLIDEEVQAIEQFLLGQGNVPSADFSNRVKILVGVMNGLALRGSVSNVISGYCLTGMRIRLPEVTTSWLTKSPGATDKEIKVYSTRDFPSSGVISIINDVSQFKFDTKTSTISRASEEGTTSIEWISYNGKTSDSFLNCTRGYMNTYVSSHTGYYPGSTNVQVATNLSDHCPVIPLTTIQKICQRRINRPYVGNTFPLFGISGTKDDIIRQLMFDGSSYRLYPTNQYLAQMRTIIGATTPTTTQIPATTWGYTTETWQRKPFVPAVPVTITDGIVTYGIWNEKWAYDAQKVLTLQYAFLKSQDFSYAEQCMLTAAEAYDFYTMAENNSAIAPYTYQSIDWPETGIPVFSGRLDVSMSFAEWTNKVSTPESSRLVLLADGTVLGYLSTQDNLNDVTQSVVEYSATLIPGY